MENKLLKQFEDKICVIKGSTRRENIIFSKTLSASDAFHKENCTTKSQDVQLRDAALVCFMKLFCQANKSRYQKI